MFACGAAALNTRIWQTRVDNAKDECFKFWLIFLRFILFMAESLLLLFTHDMLFPTSCTLFGAIQADFAIAFQNLKCVLMENERA